MFVQHTMRAVGFLSRLPVPARFFTGSESTVSAAAPMFPVAGLIIALPAAVILLVAAALGLPAFMAAVVTLAVLTLTTGALHEDGLADVADGFFGGAEPGRRLEIMKDSSIGTYGALALGFSLLFRVSALAAIFDVAGIMAATLAVLGIAAASRAAMAWFWSNLPSARKGGVADQAGVPKAASARLSVAVGTVAAAILFLPAFGLTGLLTAVALTGAVLAGFRIMCLNRIGGQTGDTLGAAQQLAELSLFTGLVIAL